MEPRHKVKLVGRGEQIDLTRYGAVKPILAVRAYVKEDGAFDRAGKDRPSICWVLGHNWSEDRRKPAPGVVREMYYAELSAETLLPVIEAIRRFWPDYAR